MKLIKGNIVDLIKNRIFFGSIRIENDKIAEIIELEKEGNYPYILPGFIDAHIHIESSMLIPSEFARLAVQHGTVATVSDPHEIANVMGLEGVRYMIENGKKVPFHFYFGASSCVPATSFETAGATLTVQDIEDLFTKDHLKYLSEVMNYPGVLSNDPLVMDKVNVAKKLNLPVDGHSPGLRGEKAKKYVEAGITTDHECFTLEEALEKISYGMNIIIREGSAAKNYSALHTLIKSHKDKVMFCSDDKHPHELVKSHINQLVKRSINDHGYDALDVLKCASLQPIKHYRLDVGLLQKNDSADFIVVDNLKEFNVQDVFIRGQQVVHNGNVLIERQKEKIINKFSLDLKKPTDFKIQSKKGSKVRVIQAIDGELITKKLEAEPLEKNGFLESDIKRDILKIAVVNRYKDAPVSIGFINNFGIKKGAIASSVAHDSHNIIVVGVTDDEMCQAVNALINSKGGIAVVEDKKIDLLPLPVGGLMSVEEGKKVSDAYLKVDKRAKELGSTLDAPFMTLSFMALLVIPSLKIGDKGLFDVDSFKFTELFIR